MDIKELKKLVDYQSTKFLLSYIFIFVLFMIPCLLSVSSVCNLDSPYEELSPKHLQFDCLHTHSSIFPQKYSQN